jgi:tRNA A37 methylthiotransferase MiaB
VETRGCPKNQVDSDKLAGPLVAQGFELASGPDRADLVVVNTCAFVEDARQESIDTVLEALDERLAVLVVGVQGVGRDLGRNDVLLRNHLGQTHARELLEALHASCIGRAGIPA